jgi:hypothetical protein
MNIMKLAINGLGKIYKIRTNNNGQFAAKITYEDGNWIHAVNSRGNKSITSKSIITEVICIDKGVV